MNELPAKEETIIKVENLKKVFSSKNGVVNALDDINLEIDKGEIFGIIGMSGAGKTTLVRCMNLLEKPTSGKIIVNGKILNQLSKRELQEERKSITMIFQGFNLLMQKTVEQNIKFALDIADIKGDKANERVDELLKIVDLPDKKNAYPSQLSGGQKQRIAIARALATNPQILLCDEATSALDPKTTNSILELLKEINQKLGITIVVITHEMSVIREICDRVAVMEGSRVAEVGTVENVFARPKSKAARNLFANAKMPVWQGKQYENAYRIVFEGIRVSSPLISSAVLASQAHINIVYANVETISEREYGQMIVKFEGTQQQQKLALDYLNSQNLIIEEVKTDEF